VKYAGLDSAMTALLYRELKFLVVVIATTFLVYLVGLTLLGISFSHRVAGVMFSIKRTIRQINEGMDVQLKFRAKDEFQDVQDAFNKMVRGLREGNIKKSA
jgi:nitrogen fixation/metabolism regulation signal transduction histidine kinase